MVQNSISASKKTTNNKSSRRSNAALHQRRGRNTAGGSPPNPRPTGLLPEGQGIPTGLLPQGQGISRSQEGLACDDIVSFILGDHDVQKELAHQNESARTREPPPDDEWDFNRRRAAPVNARESNRQMLTRDLENEHMYVSQYVRLKEMYLLVRKALPASADTLLIGSTAQVWSKATIHMCEQLADRRRGMSGMEAPASFCRSMSFIDLKAAKDFAALAEKTANRNGAGVDAEESDPFLESASAFFMPPASQPQGPGPRPWASVMSGWLAWLGEEDKQAKDVVKLGVHAFSATASYMFLNRDDEVYRNQHDIQTAVMSCMLVLLIVALRISPITLALPEQTEDMAPMQTYMQTYMQRYNQALWMAGQMLMSQSRETAMSGLRSPAEGLLRALAKLMQERRLITVEPTKTLVADEFDRFKFEVIGLIKTVANIDGDPKSYTPDDLRSFDYTHRDYSVILERLQDIAGSECMDSLRNTPALKTSALEQSALWRRAVYRTDGDRNRDILKMFRTRNGLALTGQSVSTCIELYYACLAEFQKSFNDDTRTKLNDLSRQIKGEITNHLREIQESIRYTCDDVREVPASLLPLSWYTPQRPEILAFLFVCQKVPDVCCQRESRKNPLLKIQSVMEMVTFNSMCVCPAVQPGMLPSPQELSVVLWKDKLLYGDTIGSLCNAMEKIRNSINDS